jgi:hypothetical protein
MKKLLALILCAVATSVCAQQIPMLTFDPGDTTYTHLVSIDTTHYHHNIWQVGSPHKTVFSSAKTSPHVIVTDTLRPYATNDTSVFIVKMPLSIPESASSSWLGPLYIFQFFYQLNIDSNSTARFEISDDSGLHWVNVSDSLPHNYYWTGTPVDLSHSTTDWALFNLTRNSFTLTGDSIMFRFTFISGSNTSSKDGWMIDNIFSLYYFEAVPQIRNDNLISIYPNPTNGNLYIHSNKPISKHTAISVFNLQGLEVYKTDRVTENTYLNLSLPEGVYMLRYARGDEFAMKRVLIEK